MDLVLPILVFFVGYIAVFFLVKMYRGGRGRLHRLPISRQQNSISFCCIVGVVATVSLAAMGWGLWKIFTYLTGVPPVDGSML
jgi:hypothetical protein